MVKNKLEDKPLNPQFNWFDDERKRRINTESSDSEWIDLRDVRQTTEIGKMEKKQFCESLWVKS